MYIFEDLKTRESKLAASTIFSCTSTKNCVIYYMEEKKINGRKHVKLKCSYSGEYFWKDKGEYSRRIKLNPNHKFYKSIKDAALGAGEKNYAHLKPYMGVVSENFRKASSNRKDQFSAFKYFIKQAKLRAKNKDKFKTYDITLEYLKSLWESQNGICAISGVKMELPATLAENRSSPFCASLDRIDSSIGYMQGNVQFVTQFCNLGKCSFDTDIALNFIQAVKSC